MIERLEIENLKSLEGRHCVELAPITLIYGPNSFGKSSILQALALLKQTLESPTTSIHAAHQPLNLRGDLVDLGSYAAAIHGHQRRRRLRIGVGFQAPAEVGGKPRMRADAHGYVGLGFRYDGRSSTVDQHEAIIALNGHDVRFVPAEPAAMDDRLYTANERFFRVASTESGERLLALVREMTPHLGADDLTGRFEDFLEFEKYQPLFRGQGCFPQTPWLRPWATSGRAAAAPESSAKLANRVNSLVYGTAVSLVDVLEGLSYLGPLRAAPTRFLARQGAQYTNVGPRGEYTPLFLLQQQSLTEPINRWLARLHVHYRLEVAHIKTNALGSAIGDLVVAQLHDTRTSLGLTLQDVGFGISQLLPIVVEVLAARGRTVCIEQPEIHIHPRMQTELGDLFIESAEQHDNQLIVETHSEHLMLRVLRRLRESSGGGWLTPDKVCVLYVDQSADGRSKLQRLRVDVTGEFLDEWPQGFFTERIEELFTSHTVAEGAQGSSAP